ncbi:MAG: hypothetical protein AAGC54_18215, partial [Cyanobacteria bacterium P01_F01_bin.4]
GRPAVWAARGGGGGGGGGRGSGGGGGGGWGWGGGGGGGGPAFRGGGVGFFLLNAWVPIAAPLAAFVLSGGSLLTYRRYRLRQLNQGITKVF